MCHHVPKEDSILIMYFIPVKLVFVCFGSKAQALVKVSEGAQGELLKSTAKSFLLLREDFAAGKKVFDLRKVKLL